MKCCLNRPLFLTHMAIFPYLLPFSATAICSCWLFPAGLCEIPSPALQDLFWIEEKTQFVCLRPRGKALHPSKQTKWVFISAEEGARKFLLDDLKAMYPGHLLWQGYTLDLVSCPEQHVLLGQKNPPVGCNNTLVLSQVLSEAFGVVFHMMLLS